MKPSSWVGLVAALLWLAALWTPPEHGRNLVLIDLSASCIDAKWEIPESFDQGFFFAGELSRQPAGVGDRRQTRLGEALIALRPFLRSGDCLHLFSDGMATSTLPPVAQFADLLFEWHSPSVASLIYVDGPDEFPSSGLINLLLRFDRPPGTGQLEITCADGCQPLLSQLEGIDNNSLLLRVDFVTTHESAALEVIWRGQSITRKNVIIPAAVEYLVYSNQELPAGNWQMSDLEIADLAVLVDDHQHSPEELLAAVGAKPVLWVSDRPSFWAQVPPTAATFSGLTRNRVDLILLDHSGSMDVDAWESAIAQLEQLATGENKLQVWTFAAGLEGPFNPANAVHFAALKAFPLHGPTHLYEAVEFANATAGGGRLIILSDGGDPRADQLDWHALGVQLESAFAQVICVPLGPTPKLELLAEFGEITANPEMLLLAAADLQSERMLDQLRPSHSAWFDLPESMNLDQGAVPLALLEGAVPLMVDASGAAALAMCSRRGVYDFALNSTDPQALARVLNAILVEIGSPNFLQSGAWVWSDANARQWRVIQDLGGSSKVLAFEAYDADIWRAGPLTTDVNASLLAPSGSLIPLPHTMGEFNAGISNWERWLHRQKEAQQENDSAYPSTILLLFALALMAIAVALRRYGS